MAIQKFMTLADRIKVFHELGEYLHAIDKTALEEVIDRAMMQNSWFTRSNIVRAIDGVTKFLHADKLNEWTSAYPMKDGAPKTVGLVMAGNIPLVGFHDLLCVLIAGHHAQVKTSSRDSVLILFIIEKLISFDARIRDRIAIVEQLKDFDAVIATGSDNSARYFEYYFRKHPSIIRKNRTSCAILTGSETSDDLKKLGDDVFSYFGLGCRNVSKIYIPQQYDITRVYPNWETFEPIIHHHKYHNNYDYQKSIMLVNSVPFLDNGFLMLTEHDKLVSPISVVFYERYEDLASLRSHLHEHASKIQCIVGKAEPAEIEFGQSQYPALEDYADRIDTLKFLTELP